MCVREIVGLSYIDCGRGSGQPISVRESPISKASFWVEKAQDDLTLVSSVCLDHGSPSLDSICLELL